MDKDRQQAILRVTLAGTGVNLVLVVFKLFAGFAGNSTALVADAGHSLSDLASDLVIFCFVRISGKPEDDDHSYGHGKYETLATFVVGLTLLAAGIGFLWDGTAKIAGFFEGKALSQPGWIAFIVAILSILCKEMLYRYTMGAAARLDSAVLRTNAWHHRSDAFSSLATVLGTGGAMLPGHFWVLLDPGCACLISLFIIAIAIPFIKSALDELMEKSLPSGEQDIIGQAIISTPGVISYHRLRTRRIGDARAVEAHIKLNGNISLYEAHEIASRIEIKIKNALGSHTHVGIHMEPADKAAENDPGCSPGSIAAREQK